METQFSLLPENPVANVQLANLFEVEELEQRLEFAAAAEGTGWGGHDWNSTSSY